MSVELVRSILEPEGFVAREIRDDLPNAEQHIPGAGQVGSTALAIWGIDK